MNKEEFEELLLELYKPETAKQFLKFWESMKYEDIPKIPWSSESTEKK